MERFCAEQCPIVRNLHLPGLGSGTPPSGFLRSLRLASYGGGEGLLSHDSHFYGEEGMLEKSVNFQSSRPVNMKRRRKHPSQLLTYPEHKSSLPPISSLLFPTTWTEIHFWMNTPCYHTVRHTDAGGPKVRHTLNTPDTAGPHLRAWDGRQLAAQSPLPAPRLPCPPPHALWRNSDRLAFSLRPHSVLKSGCSAVLRELGPPV